MSVFLKLEFFFKDLPFDLAFFFFYLSSSKLMHLV